MIETLTTNSDQRNETREVLPSESTCNNGGCTRPVYRGKQCFRCWAGTKWTSIRQRVENKNGHNPHYEGMELNLNKFELIGWIIKNPPPVDMQKPSIDRIDNSKGYSLKNIRWLEHRINSRHRQRDTPEGFRKCVGCGEIKALVVENWSTDGKNKWQGRCRPCKLKYDRVWRTTR